MDNGLVLCNEVKYGTSDFEVLILIIVDNGLVPKIRQNMPELSCCINPCCSGRWSRTYFSAVNHNYLWVLILVVVEDGFILLLRCSHLWEQRVLILVVVDDGLVLLKKGQRIPKATS